MSVAPGIDRRLLGMGLVWTNGSGIPGCAKFEEAADVFKPGDSSFA
jgi:hypothetical protein